MVKANKERLERIREIIREIVSSPSTEGAILAGVAAALGMRFRDVVHLYLCRTAVYVALASLERG